jgi:hypothetical protein
LVGAANSGDKIYKARWPRVPVPGIRVLEKRVLGPDSYYAKNNIFKKCGQDKR